MYCQGLFLAMNITFLRYQEWVNLSKEEKLLYNRVTLFFPDVSIETQTQRGEFSPMRELLRKLNVKFALWYPAKLKKCSAQNDKVFPGTRGYFQTSGQGWRCGGYLEQLWDMYVVIWGVLCNIITATMLDFCLFKF